MPTYKLLDNDDVDFECVNPEHGPPQHRVFENGNYVHVCPACGTQTKFRVNRPVH